MPLSEIKLNLHPLIKKLEVFSTKNISGELTGRYITNIRGKGLEFDGFRTYSINDDAKSIDWKASLRSQNVLVKKFVEERQLNVYFMFDVSNSMLFASTNKLKCEYAAELIASLAFAILHAGDNVGMAMFTDKIVKNIPPMMGNKQYYAITRSLMNPKLYGGKYDFETAMSFMNTFIKKQSLVIIVSDFIGLKGDWMRHLEVVAKKFDIIPIIIKDPRDKELPEEMCNVIVQDPFSGRQMLLDPEKVREDYRKEAKKREDEVISAFKKMHVKSLVLTTNKEFVNPLLKFVATRG